MADKVTAPHLFKLKSKGHKIVCLTAYDATSSQMADEAGVDVILVGDSVGNVVQGHETTIPVTLDQIVYHTQCVASKVKSALVVADLPFGSYQVSPMQAVESSIRLMKAGAQAVKLEGSYLDAISAISKAGIPVMGHEGMTPQSVHAFGGFKVQGKGASGTTVKERCLQAQDAGAFAVVLELIPADLAKDITKELKIPTIGIGAGPDCDGQIQVWHDILALNESVFKHSKAFVEGRKLFLEGIRGYASEVRGGSFPNEENSF